ncbi:hypothetical protein FKM82_027499 [Ascaphus truei]
MDYWQVYVRASEGRGRTPRRASLTQLAIRRLTEPPLPGTSHSLADSVRRVAPARRHRAPGETISAGPASGLRSLGSVGGP